MTNEIRIFESPEFGQIRTVKDEKGEPWFCLRDVCKVLGLKQGDVCQRLAKGLVSTQPLSTRGGMQMANFVNYSQLCAALEHTAKYSAYRSYIGLGLESRGLRSLMIEVINNLTL